MRALFASLSVLAALATPAAAETLAESMASALETNPSLGAQRQRYNAAREALPQALSAALPQVSLSGLALASDRDSNDPLTETDRVETWTSSANVSQLLFGSGRVLAATRAARAEIAGAAANYELARQNLLLDVTRAYADVRQALAAVAARETTVANLTRLLEFAQAQFEAGVVTRTDVAQSQARLAQARLQLAQANGALAAATQAYQRLVGRPPSDLQEPMSAMGLPSDLEVALAQAEENSPILLGAMSSVALADANVDVAAAQGRWNVTLEAGQVRGADFADSNTETSTDNLGVRVTVPLFQGGLVRSRTRAQRALRLASNLDLAAAQRQVAELVTNAWTGLVTSQAAVTSAREQLEAAELAYEGVRLEQEIGLRSTVEVLDQEQDLLTARLALAQAERDLVVAERQLLAAVGRLEIPQGGGGIQDRDGLRGR